MNLSRKFAWRYFKARKSTNAINIIAWISIAAITIGTAALILVLSVFNGFEGLVKSLYSSFYTDLKVFPGSGKVMTITPAQLQQLRGLSGVRNFSLVVEEKALLQNGEYQSVVYLKGVDGNYRYVTGVARSLVKGAFTLGTGDAPSLVLGAGIENAVGVQADRNLLPLFVYLPRRSGEAQLDPMQSISMDTITTSGTFVIQQDFDNKYAITNLDFMRRMLGLGPQEYSGLEIALGDPGQADRMKPAVEKLFPPDRYKVQTRYEQNQGLYSVMGTEKWVIYAVLSLILVVAAFNIIGALTMLVLEKEKDIAVLHALGGSRGFIQRIFLSEGLLLAIAGGLLGMVIALVISYLQIRYKLIPLAGGTFLIDYFPVKLKWSDFLLVGSTVLVIALLASWLPARKAAAGQLSLRAE
ncbi:MAG TPA: FtsX-like permease family protein [Chitinophagaceae bacterium]|nr:FtsX-like permease family protein [Chitinophagaceae bacterium]